MNDDTMVAGAVADGRDPAIGAILREVCDVTGMGFAALARVTEDRWIACQVLDRIEFGLDPGAELEIKTTICNDIRESGRAVVIDEVAADPAWRSHHTPALYGFASYASFPVVLDDDSFYGTLCAIDPEPRAVTAPEVVAAMQRYAVRVAELLSTRAD